MRKLIYTLVAIATLGGSAFAQQLPLYSQYYFNKFIYNPAFAGEQVNTEAYLISRRQWNEVPGYETNAITVSGVPGNTNVGLGFHAVNDKNSLVRTNSVYGSYAYRAKITETEMIALGFSIGMWDSRFDLNNVVVTDQDDPIIPLLNNKGGPIVDANIGFNVILKDIQIGLALPQVFAGRQNYRDNYQRVVDYNLQSHFIATASYDIWAIPEKLKIQPFLMYKSTKNAPDQVDANLMIDWIGKGWIGAAYRDDYAMTFTAGVQLAKMMRIGYAYDLSIHEQSAALGGTNELTIGVSLNKNGRMEKDVPMKEQKIGESMKDSIQEVRIQELSEELEELKKSGGIKDTVVLVKRIETTVKVPAETPSRTEEPKRTTTTPTESNRTKTTPTKSDDGKASGKFILVAGSFSDVTYANAYVTRLKNQGHDAYVTKASNGTYYVHVGGYNDKDEARDAMKSGSNSSLNLWIKTMQ